MHLVPGLLLLSSVASAADSKTGWLETKTAHVTVKTDLSQDNARRAVVLAEQTRTALLAAAWPGSKLDQDRIELIVFANHQEFEKYFGDLVQDKVVLGEYPPTVFLYGSPNQWEKRLALERPETTSMLRQALAQHLATFFYRRQPRWFAVGLSEFLETLRISEDGNAALLGSINLRAMSDYGSHRSVNVADALAWGTTFNPTDEGTLLGLNALSWLMVQWLVNTHLPEFVRFQKLLITGLDPAKAWKVVFPTLVPGDLDRELNHYLQYGSQGVSQVAIPETENTVDQERPLSSAEVHAIRAEAWLAAGQTKDAQAELSVALADDPGNVGALRRQMPLLKPAERLVLAHKATAAHPDDGRAWLMVGDALRESGGSPEEAALAYKKAMELSPDHPGAYGGLAALDVQRGQPADAVPLALAAVRMAPWDASFLDTLAGALAGIGHCSEAVSAEARAMDMAAERNAAKRTEYAARVGEIQKTCTEAPAAAPPAPPAPPTAPQPTSAPGAKP
jgi:tetratricopeptide (TPR) repeat protein